MTQKTLLADRSNYGAQRKLSDIEYIALHYTANDGDSDEGNATYFTQHKNLKASAHYFVDDDSYTQSVPDDYVAYSVGGSKWTDCSMTGGGKLYGVATNANTLNIEMCDTVKDGIIKAQEATLVNTIKLIRKLMKKYDIDIDHVIRHFDVNGKHCPAYLMDESEWEAFKARILGYRLEQAYKTTAACYLRSTPGVGDNKLLYKEASAKLRKKCKQSGDYIKLKRNKAFTLTEVKMVGKDKWGKIKSGYWLPLQYRGIKRAQ